MDGMKRGQMDEADKHSIRRRIEEKHVMIREQRKVRERLSRECADTLRHIAATKATIKHIKAQHQEALNLQADDFKYSTAAEKHEVKKREEQRAELERVVASSDIVEREQEVLSARLAALRVDDEKEEAANAREMDGLKRKLFNVRNELETVFRTTLHDLNVAYQEQAFDAMVEEATRARSELPSLRVDLCVRTREVNRVMAKQCRSFEGTRHVMGERDITEGFVKLQARRSTQIKKAVAEQREVVEREQADMKQLGENLEAFQAEAQDLREAAAELRHLREESIRKGNECLNLRAWAQTLSKKGPTALKSKWKRQRLVALTSAALAPFYTSRTSAERSAQVDLSDRAKSKESVASHELQPTLADGCKESDHSERPHLYPDMATGQSSGNTPDESEKSPPPVFRTVSLMADLLNDQRRNDQQSNGHSSSSSSISGDKKNGPKCDNDQDNCNDQRPPRACHGSPTRPERDTLAETAGSEAGGRLHVVAAKKPRLLLPKKSATDAGGGVEGFHHNAEAGVDASSVGRKPRPELASFLLRAPEGRINGNSNNSDNLNVALERIWRASLSDDRQRRGGNTASKDKFIPDTDPPPPSPPPPPPTNSAIDDNPSTNGTHSASRRDDNKAPPSVRCVEIKEEELVALKGVEGGGGDWDAGSALLGGEGASARQDFNSSKLPAEVLASMLLADHDFALLADDGDKKSSGDALDRARRRGNARRLLTRPPRHQPLPDLPYGFTDLGRRVNVGSNGHGGEDNGQVVLEAKEGDAAAAESVRGDDNMATETWGGA